ncbi:hypothetical protein P43SY_010273 [Pythium insidiosum]|uniref:Reverse transcriptase domain-containing protein n=1 Tax=Pythium insidiosum TaxID=114742 RepID=A0AAD5Q324_PYTIN|nr:hypothetical protein P43SY_010273 [Pythium insidiosum]
MTPAGVRLDLAEGVALLPDEVRVRFEGRRPVYSDRAEQVRIKAYATIYPADSIEADLSEVDWDQRSVESVSTCASVSQCSSEGDPGDRRQEAGTTDALPVMKPQGVTSPVDWATVAVASLAARGIDDIPRVDQADLGPTVFIHEGADMAAEEIEGQMALIPEVPDADRDISIEDVQVATGEDVPAEWVDRVKQIVWRRKEYLMGKRNARPPAARGVVCDIDVGDARPIAQRCRRVPPQYSEKLYELIKGLLDAGFIVPSTSPWASPIVIVVKKNGVDIRLCIDYRVVNELTRLMVYPMPIVQDLLEDLAAYRWFCSLDMASGFWVVKMTPRARAISAFVTLFGLFEWTRMPFGLKNAPQINQRLLDNALYGFLKLAPEHEQDGRPDVFDRPVPEDRSTKPASGRRSFIDDILVAGSTWEEMCTKLERLMEACEKWGLSISLPKSVFGVGRVDYLGHSVSAEGVKANPKNLEELQQLEFPKTLKGIQSFLGSLNFYHKFIEHFAVYAAALYEVTAADLATDQEDPDRLKAAKAAFEALKSKLVEAPILRHYEADRRSTIVVYANDWSVAGSLMQDWNGELHPMGRPTCS